MGGRGFQAGTVDITSLLRLSANDSPVSPTRPLRPASVPSTPKTTPHDLPPRRLGPVAPTLLPSNRRSMPPHVPDQPVKKQSKWSPEEDAIIIELRGRGMKWEDVSKRLPGRSAISCRLHYQNYLERRSEWDEERKNKLARLYERYVMSTFLITRDPLMYLCFYIHNRPLFNHFVSFFLCLLTTVGITDILGFSGLNLTCGPR